MVLETKSQQVRDRCVLFLLVVLFSAPGARSLVFEPLGSTWNFTGQAAGLGGNVYQVEALNSTHVMFAGQFVFAADACQPCVDVALWTGSHWAPVAPLAGVTASVHEVFRGESGTLYLGGSFRAQLPSGVNASSIVAYDVASDVFSALGEGLPIIVYEVYERSVTEVYAGGSFDGLLSRWDGTSWTLIPNLNGSRVNLLHVMPTAPLLMVGGLSFMPPGGSPGVSLYNMDTGVWSPVGEGLSPTFGAGGAYCAVTHGSDVIIGGLFQESGALTGFGNLAIYSEDGILSPFGIASGSVTKLALDPIGPAVFAVGRFYNIDLAPFSRFMARRQLGNPVGPWLAVNETMRPDNFVESIEVTPTSVYVGGLFWNVGGNRAMRNVARIPLREAGLTVAPTLPPTPRPTASPTREQVCVTRTEDVFITETERITCLRVTGTLTISSGALIMDENSVLVAGCVQLGEVIYATQASVLKHPFPALCNGGTRPRFRLVNASEPCVERTLEVPSNTNERFFLTIVETRLCEFPVWAYVAIGAVILVVIAAILVAFCVYKRSKAQKISVLA